MTTISEEKKGKQKKEAGEVAQMTKEARTRKESRRAGTSGDRNGSHDGIMASDEEGALGPTAARRMWLITFAVKTVLFASK